VVRRLLPVLAITGFVDETGDPAADKLLARDGRKGLL
jgi:hypothetical protein